VQAIANTFASLAPIFHRSEKTYSARPITVTVTRRGEYPGTVPVILLLEGDRQQIAAGRRALALRWFGGTPPFQIQLRVRGNTKPLLSARTMTSTAVLDGLTYAVNQYRISVSDVAGASGSGTFNVVSPDRLPVLSRNAATAIRSPATPRYVAAGLDAARLMADPTGTWDFEAYQRVIGYRDRSALARRLVRALELGFNG
jgi:hypothetical protein